MSGGLSDFRAIGILVVNRSLWIGTTLIVTFGCEAWNAAATLSQTPSRGWVLPLFHQVRVTLALLDALALVLEVLLLPLLLPLLLHAAIVSAAATAVATMTGFLEPRMRSHLLTMPRNSWCRVCYWPGLLALPKAADAMKPGDVRITAPKL
jgi:hypothetical protein